MTRRNNARQHQRKNVRSKPRRRRTTRRENAVLPPAKTLMGHIMRTVVQTAWDIAQGALQVPDSHRQFDDHSHLSLPQPLMKATANGTQWTQWNIDTRWLLAQGWIDRFKGLFKQIKVHRITAHYLPYESITAMGEYVFGLWDKDQDSVPDSFSTAVGTPSSVIRKNGQPAKLVWYPTEPDDRNWHTLNDAHNYCSSCLFQAESSYNYDPPNNTGQPVQPSATVVGVEGKIIIDVDASFRGKPESPRVTGYQKCVCRKCIRPVLARLIAASETASESGSTTPFMSV